MTNKDDAISTRYSAAAAATARHTETSPRRQVTRHYADDVIAPITSSCSFVTDKNVVDPE